MQLKDAILDILLAAYLADDADQRVVKMAKKHLKNKTIQGKKGKACMKMIINSSAPRVMLLRAHENFLNGE